VLDGLVSALAAEGLRSRSSLPPWASEAEGRKLAHGRRAHRRRAVRLFRRRGRLASSAGAPRSPSYPRPELPARRLRPREVHRLGDSAMALLQAGGVAGRHGRRLCAPRRRRRGRTGSSPLAGATPLAGARSTCWIRTRRWLSLAWWRSLWVGMSMTQQETRKSWQDIKPRRRIGGGYTSPIPLPRRHEDTGGSWSPTRAYHRSQPDRVHAGVGLSVKRQLPTPGQPPSGREPGVPIGSRHPSPGRHGRTR